MSRLLDNRLRRLEAQRPRDPFAGLSDDELDTLCSLVRDALDGSESAPEHSVPEEARARLWGAVTAFLDGSTRAPQTS